MIDLGGQSVFFVVEGGEVWSCGDSRHGALGYTSKKSLIVAPSKIPNLSKIVSVSAGDYHTLFLDADGTVWACGCNDRGELGLGDNNPRNKPEKIEDIPPVQSVFASFHFSLLLDVNGCVWSFGANFFGQLGLGDNTDRRRPEVIRGLPFITSIYASSMFSIFLDATGSVWSSGCDLYAKTRVATPYKITDIPPVVSVTHKYSGVMLLDEDGSIWFLGDAKYHPKYFTAKKGSLLSRSLLPVRIKTVSVGKLHELFLDETGGVWSSGDNSSGQLGRQDQNANKNAYSIDIIPGLPKIISIATGDTHSLFLDVEGTVWICGNHCGFRSPVPQPIPRIPKIYALYASKSCSILHDIEGFIWQVGGFAKGACEEEFSCQRVPTPIVPLQPGCRTKSARNCA